MADDYQVVVKGRWSDSLDETRNIFYAHAEGSSIPAFLADWATDMWVGGTSPLIDILTPTWGIYSVEIKSRDTDHWVTVAEVPTLVVGGLAGEPMPHLIAAVVTGVTISRSRPKKFIAGTCESAQESGLLNAGAVAALSSFADNWITPFSTGATGYGGYWHEDVGGGSVLPIAGYRVNAVLGTQRRRKQGRGI